MISVRMSLLLSIVASVMAVGALAPFAAKASNEPHHIETRTIAQTPPFMHPGLYKLPDGSYEAYFATDDSSFYPSTITVPIGSNVTFFVTSPHLVRGFAIVGQGIYMMAGPGQVGTANYQFDAPDTYLLVCNEYCGLDHLGMHAIITVK